MNSRLWLIGCLVLVVGCSTARKDTANVPIFEDSNAYLIHKSIDDIKLLEAVSTHIDRNENIALVSIERDMTQDTAISAMIEDVFIKELVDVISDNHFSRLTTEPSRV